MTTLAAGAYPIDLYYFKAVRRSPRLEFSAAAGNQTAYNFSSFHLVGDTANGGLGVVGGNSEVATNLSRPCRMSTPRPWSAFLSALTIPGGGTQLTLSMEYDDGFIAYLNGAQVASANAPASPAWNSTATAANCAGQATSYQLFDLSSYQLYLLQGGQNVLAIQGLNIASGDPDFLVLPKLQYGSVNLSTIEYFTTPTPGAANVPVVLGRGGTPISASTTASITAPFGTPITCDTGGVTIRYHRCPPPPPLPLPRPDDHQIPCGGPAA